MKQKYKGEKQMENQTTKKPIHEYWDYMNQAMCDIANAAVVAINNPDVFKHIESYGCCEETCEPVFWVMDYIKKMFED